MSNAVFDPKVITPGLVHTTFKSVLKSNIPEDLISRFLDYSSQVPAGNISATDLENVARQYFNSLHFGNLTFADYIEKLKYVYTFVYVYETAVSKLDKVYGTAMQADTQEAKETILAERGFILPYTPYIEISDKAREAVLDAAMVIKNDLDKRFIKVNTTIVQKITKLVFGIVLEGYNRRAREEKYVALKEASKQYSEPAEVLAKQLSLMIMPFKAKKRFLKYYLACTDGAKRKFSDLTPKDAFYGVDYFQYSGYLSKKIKEFDTMHDVKQAIAFMDNFFAELYTFVNRFGELIKLQMIESDTTADQEEKALLGVNLFPKPEDK